MINQVVQVNESGMGNLGINRKSNMTRAWLHQPEVHQVGRLSGRIMHIKYTLKLLLYQNIRMTGCHAIRLKPPHLETPA